MMSTAPSTSKRPPSEIQVFIVAADLLVSPRTRGTNTPLKIYSHLRSGRPIVATNLRTHTQVLDERTARLSPPQAQPFADAVGDLIEQPAERHRLAEAARDLAATRYGRGCLRGQDRRRISSAAGPHDGSGHVVVARDVAVESLVTVLVTGVTGFTGGHLARYLGQQGFDVRGLVRPSSQALGRDLEAEGIKLVVGDVTDRTSLDPACRDVDVVYHIAASYRTAGKNDEVYRAVNVTGTSNLLEAARAAGTRRFVHCSTGGVHGHVEHPPATEDTPLAPGAVRTDRYSARDQRGRR